MKSPATGLSAAGDLEERIQVGTASLSDWLQTKILEFAPGTPVRGVGYTACERTGTDGIEFAI